MKNELETLIKMQKWSIDQKRKRLSVFLVEEAKFENKIKELIENNIKEKQFAKENPIFTNDYAAFVEQFLKDKEEFEIKLARVKEMIAIIQDDIAEEFKIQKTYEITDENRKKLAQEELDRKEQISMDEIGMNLHRRKKLKETSDED